MREITKLMIKDFKIMELGYDFLGYKVNRTKDLSFHPLIIPYRESKNYRIGDGYLYWNGAILRQNTSHDYLHVIEHVDFDMFSYVTSEMIDMNIKGYLDPHNIRNIHDVLNQFEKEHCSDVNHSGKKLIKDIYTHRVKF